MRHFADIWAHKLGHIKIMLSLSAFLYFVLKINLFRRLIVEQQTFFHRV